MRKYFFILWFIFYGFFGKSQNINDDFCGAPQGISISLKKEPWHGNNEFLRNYLNSIDYYNQINNQQIFYRFPLKVWAFKKSDGSGGITEKEIKEQIQYLNHYFSANKTGIQFYLSEILYIKKNKRLIQGYYIEAPLMGFIHHKQGFVNIYMPENMVRKRFNKSNWYHKGTYNYISQSVILVRYATETALAHEIGHFFGLWHTHRNYNRGKLWQESVSRSRKINGLFRRGLNCEHNGDKISDTPAEPRLSSLVDNECNFTGTGLCDNWGDIYKPQTNNLMSYPTFKNCRKIFSQNQIAVMLYKAGKKNNAKRYSVAQTKKYPSSSLFVFDKFEPDNYSGMETLLKPDSVQYHTFHHYYITRKKVENKDIDWFSIVPENKQTTIKIKITEGKIGTTNIKLTLYKEQEILKTVYADPIQNPVIEFTISGNGPFLLKAEQEKPVTGMIFDYNIKLMKK